MSPESLLKANIEACILTKEKIADVLEQNKAAIHVIPILQAVLSPVSHHRHHHHPLLCIWLQELVHFRIFVSFLSPPWKRLQTKECNARTRSLLRSCLFHRSQKQTCLLTPIRTIGKPTWPTHLTERRLHRYVSSKSKSSISSRILVCCIFKECYTAEMSEGLDADLNRKR